VTSRLGYFTSGGALRKIATECGAEVLVTLYGGGFATMAYLSGFRPFAVFVVGSDILLQAGIRRPISRLALQAADTVFVNGEYLHQKTREMAPRARLAPLLLGIDTARFTPGSPPEQPVRIICTRGFSPIYNNDYLIRALAVLPADLPDFQVTFAAPGPELDAVRALADDLLPAGLRERVEFLGGVSHEHLVENLQSAHIYVSLSRSDGTSMSLLEALSCGLFPVLSDIPQNREWVSPEARNGTLVPLEAPPLLANALAEAICDTERRRQASAWNRNLVLERACNRRNMTTLTDMLAGLLPANRREQSAPVC
jgi:glycosyltransferase involved in cell wall biosynthesis